MRRAEPGVWPNEAQRREEKRAQARLAGGLQQLDEARLYQLKTLTREQWRIHRDLGVIRSCNPLKKTTHGLGSRTWNQDFNRPNLPYWRTPLPIIPQTGKGLEKQRSQKQKSQDAAGSTVGLQARVRDFMGGAEPRAEGFGAPLCLPDLKVQTVTGSSSTAQGENEREGEKTDMEKEGPQWEGEKPSPSPVPAAESLAPLGRLRTVHTLPSFSHALAEARKARYIRHRGLPLSDRELSVAEIFAKTTKETQKH